MGGEVILTLCEICTNGNEYKRVIFPSQEGCNKNMFTMILTYFKTLEYKCRLSENRVIFFTFFWESKWFE